MESALIVSRSENSISFFSEMTKSVSCDKIATVQTCSMARRLLMERDFDLCIVNAPLQDESGENLSRDIALKGRCQVILVVKHEYYEEVSAVVCESGVITVAKPINKNFFWSALMLAKSAHNKIRALKAENSKLMQKIEDIRIVDRAKCILISYLNMNEPEAHRYLEKQAMNLRISKREVAEGILKTYEN